MASSIRVVIVDDHQVLRDGLRTILSLETEIEVVAEAATGAEALALAEREQPDVLVLDVRLPDTDGPLLIEPITSRSPATKILMLTSHGGEETVRQALEAGAAGFVLKDSASEAIVAAVRCVAGGGRVMDAVISARLVDAIGRDRLTPREIDVLREAALGQSNKVIAAALGIKEATVRVHLTHVFEKLGARDRTDAVMIALERGIIHLR